MFDPLCAAHPEGDECATEPRRICVSGRCVVSSCGDGHVDAPEEDCEPMAPGDGCVAATCRWQCDANDDCPTAPCVETRCEEHSCVNVALTGSCEIVMGLEGVCAGGVCAPVGCGDGVVSGSEECDPGPVSVPGCVGCVAACHGDADCDDGDLCNGAEACLPAATAGHGNSCVSGRTPAITCAPMQCRNAACVTSEGAAVCRYTLDGDRDGDGYVASADCGDVGGDCNEGDPDVHPGALEICNGEDDDCDGRIDEDTSLVRWCPDDDGDGHGDPARMRTSCERPTGHVRLCDDCFDTADAALRSLAAQVHPGQTSYFTSRYCTSTGNCSFDYDCSGTEDRERTEVVDCGLLAPLLCATSRGWTDSVPACGVRASFATCQPVVLGLLCAGSAHERQQGCR